MTRDEFHAQVLSYNPLVRELLEWIADEYTDTQPPEAWRAAIKKTEARQRQVWETAAVFRPQLPAPPVGRTVDPDDRIASRRAFLALQLRKVHATQLASIESTGG